MLVVVYAGILLFFLTGPALNDVQDLRKIVFIALLGAMVAWGILLFVGSRFYTVGVPSGGEAAGPEDLGEQEVLISEYLGDEDAAMPADADDDEEAVDEAYPHS